MPKYVYRLDPERPNNTAAAIYQAARRGGPRVLDVGSGPGIISSFLVSRDGKDVTCVDNDLEALEAAREAGVTRTEVVDLRAADWYAPVAGRTYDVVVLADVLEHLVDPERVLTDLREQALVDPDGHLVVSIPNAAHEAIVVELLTGHFTYTETGLLDRTHLRFFTLDSMTALLESCGWWVEEVHRTTMPFEETRNRYRAGEVSPALRAALDERGVEGRTFQYVLRVRPAVEAARLADLAGRVDDALTQAHDATVARDRAVAEAAAAAERAERERRALADQLAAATARAAGLEREAGELRREAGELRAKLKALRQSQTYRAGEAVRGLTSPLRRVRGRGR